MASQKSKSENAPGRVLTPDDITRMAGALTRPAVSPDTIVSRYAEVYRKDPLAANADRKDILLEMGRRIKFAADLLGLNQSEIARRMPAFLPPDYFKAQYRRGSKGKSHYSRDNISRYWNGKNKPDGPTLQALSSILGPPPEWILPLAAFENVRRNKPVFQITESTNEGKANLSLNVELPVDVVLAIYKLYRDAGGGDT